MNPKYNILLNNLNEQLNFIDLEIDDQIKKCEQAITIILKSINELKKLTAKNALLETGGYSKSSIKVSNIVTIDASGDSEIELYGEPIKIEMKRFADSAELYKKPSK